MLSWSSESFGYPVEIRSIANPRVDPRIPGGVTLLGLVDAYLLGDGTQRAEARQTVIDELGSDALVDAAAVFGNFEMMNRIAEGTGIPVARQAIEREAGTMKTLGLYDILKTQHH